MMTVEDRIVDRNEASTHHHERLLKAFGGSMDGWEYTGEIRDAGKNSQSSCACGHPIRYEYVWFHPKKGEVITGSTCVWTVPWISEETVSRMKADLEELRARAREAKRKIRLARQSAEVQQKLAEVKSKLDNCRIGRLFHENSDRVGWVEGEIYSARYWYGRYKSEIARALNLKTPKGQLNRLCKVQTWIESEEE
jgi:hypothetical protein